MCKDGIKTTANFEKTNEIKTAPICIINKTNNCLVFMGHSNVKIFLILVKIKKVAKNI